MKHTPGPWEWVENKLRGGLSGIVGANGEEVLFPNHCNDGDEGDAWFEDFPSAADKSLLSAAPSLLEALEDTEDALLEILDCLEGPTFATATEAIDQIRQSIAKATGGQP